MRVALGQSAPESIALGGAEITVSPVRGGEETRVTVHLSDPADGVRILLPSGEEVTAEDLRQREYFQTKYADWVRPVGVVVVRGGREETLRLPRPYTLEDAIRRLGNSKTSV